MSRLPAWSGIFVMALLSAACGGGSSTFENTTGGSDASGGATFSLAIVTADLDLDGVSDVLEIPVGAEGEAPAEEPRCFRGDGAGGLLPAEHFRDHPLLDAIRRDLSGRTEQDVLDDEGAHRAPVAGGRGVPYAVLHLETPGDGPDGEAGVPIIDALHPESAHAGALVGIRGTDLATRDDETIVTFDTVAADVLFARPRFVLAFVPDDAALGVQDVVVTRGTLASEAADFEVVAAPTPTVTAVHPEPVVPGILAVVRGEHLGTPADDVGVTFGGVAAEHVLPLGRKLIVMVPDDAASGMLIVTVGGVPSAGYALDVGAALDTPELTALAPGAAAAGSLVEIEGQDLFVIGQRPQVHFGSAQASVFGRTRESIIAIVPAEADGDVTVTVGGRTSDGLPFVLRERGAPVITTIDPATGAPGDLVAIEGTDLYDLGGLLRGMGPRGMPLKLPRVSFGEQPAFFVFPTPTGLHVMVPFGLPADSLDVVVEQDGTSSDPVRFTVE